MEAKSVKHALQLAALLQSESRLTLAVDDDSLCLLEHLVTDDELYATVQPLFKNGHYTQAVSEAYKFVNNLVKSRSKIGADGAGLMRTAFSASNPILRLNALSNQSEKDEQQGYMDLFAGCMVGIRNPRAHEHNWPDEQSEALELLILANHLTRRIRQSKVRRKRDTSKSRAAS